MNGCIQPSNLPGMVRAEYVSDICPRIDASERLADGESRANPRRNHMRVNSVGSRTGQMRHQLSLRILQRQDAVLVLACFQGELMTRREILRRYRHLRAIVTRHHSAALKFQAPAAILEQAKHIGLAAGHTLITDNEQELTVLFDLVIYNAKQGRSRAIDRYAKTAQLPAGSDEALMLEALRRARFGLWRVERLHEITGLVISNLLSQTEAWLVDEGLWVRLADGSVFAARLCQPDRFSMTNGLVAMVTAESCAEVINDALIRQGPESDSVADDSRLATAVYRTALGQRVAPK
jgi:hypothetical protein